MKKIIHNIPFGFYLGGGERLIKGWNDNITKGSENYLFYEKHELNINDYKLDNFKVFDHNDFAGLNIMIKHINPNVIVEHGIGWVWHRYKEIYKNVTNKVVHYFHAVALFDMLEKHEDYRNTVKHIISNYKDERLDKYNIDYIVQPIQINIKDYPFFKRKYNINKIKVGIVGRISEEKVPETFIENLINFTKYNKEYEFYFLGAGMKHLEYLLTKIKGNDRIKYCGTAKPNDVIKFYKNVDILLSPSLSESGGYAIIEAMATGLPVIARSKGALLETIGGGGFCAKNNTDEELFDKLILLTQNEGIIKSFSQQARSKVEHENSNPKQQYKNLNKFILS